MKNIQNKKFLYALLFTIIFNIGLIFITATPMPVQSKSFLQDAQTKVEVTNQKVGLPESNNPSAMVGKIIKYMLSFIGTIFLILIIYGGFTWMTAGGNEEKVGSAKKIITQASIGLLVVILSYAISLYIIDVIIAANNATP